MRQDCPNFYFWVIIELCFSLTIFQFLHEKLHLSENILRRIYLRAFFVVLENFFDRKLHSAMGQFVAKNNLKNFASKKDFL